MCLDEGDGGLQVGQGCSNPPKCVVEADLKENEPLVRTPPQRSVVHEIIFGAADQGRHWGQRDCIFFCGAKKIKKKWRRRQKKFRARCKNLAFYTTESLNEPFVAEQKMNNSAAGKKIFEVQPGWCGISWCGQQPISPRYSRSTTHGGDLVGGCSGFGTPPPFFSLPENWLFCTSGLTQTRGIFYRAPLSPCEPLKRSRDGGKKIYFSKSGDGDRI